MVCIRDKKRFIYTQYYFFFCDTDELLSTLLFFKTKRPKTRKKIFKRATTVVDDGWFFVYLSDSRIFPPVSGRGLVEINSQFRCFSPRDDDLAWNVVRATSPGFGTSSVRGGHGTDSSSHSMDDFSGPSSVHAPSSRNGKALERFGLEESYKDYRMTLNSVHAPSKRRLSDSVSLDLS